MSKSLSASDKALIKKEILEGTRFKKDQNDQEIALYMLDQIKYNPSYKSGFDGSSFKDRRDKEYWQAWDKINSFFKYNTFYPDNNKTYGDLPWHLELGKYVKNDITKKTSPTKSSKVISKPKSKCQGADAAACKRKRSCKLTKPGIRRSYCRLKKPSHN
jgi:hypothetical protein